MTQPTNIIIVDDEKDIHVIYDVHFRKAIRNKQVKLHKFLNGKECLDFLNENPKIDIALILSDINMPIMDGLELLEEVKSRFPHINIKMLSAYGENEFPEQAKRLGASEFIKKPVDFTKLKESISKEFGLNF